MGVLHRSACSLGLIFFSTQKRRQTLEERQRVTLLQEVPGSGLPKVGTIDPERKNSILIPDSAQDRVTSQTRSTVNSSQVGQLPVNQSVGAGVGSGGRG